MTLPSIRLSVMAIFLSLSAVGILQASEPIMVTVIGHKPGTKFTSIKNRSVVTFQPFSDASSRLAHPAPSLPPAAATLGFKGDVGLSVEVDKSGEVRNATVSRSSGSPLLDEAARAFVQAIWLYPAMEHSTTHQEQARFHPTREDLAAENKRVAQVVSIKSVAPPYLLVARYKEWQGTLQMKLSADLSGKVMKANIVKSSGYLLLDLEAKYWCLAFWRMPKNAVTDCTITFQLR